MRRIVLFAVFSSVVLNGCALVDRETTSPTSVTNSAILGAGTGALIGAHNDEPLAGALIGGTLGALAGESERRSENRYAEKLNDDREYLKRHAVTLDQLLELTQAGVADEIVITQIHNKGAAQILTTEDIILLSKSHVAADVIKAYQTAGTSVLPRASVHQPQPIYPEARYPVPFGPVPSRGIHIGLGFGN